MRSPIIILSVVLLSLGLPCNLFAQEPSRVIPGARVRMTASTITTTRIVGTVVTLNADTIVLRHESQTSALAVPLAAVTKLEVSGAGFREGKTV